MSLCAVTLAVCCITTTIISLKDGWCLQAQTGNLQKPWLLHNWEKETFCVGVSEWRTPAWNVFLAVAAIFSYWVMQTFFKTSKAVSKLEIISTLFARQSQRTCCSYPSSVQLKGSCPSVCCSPATCHEMGHSAVWYHTCSFFWGGEFFSTTFKWLLIWHIDFRAVPEAVHNLICLSLSS